MLRSGLLLACVSFLFTVQLKGQDSIRRTSRKAVAAGKAYIPVYDRRNILIDSLSMMVDNLSYRQDSLLRVMNRKQADFNELLEKNSRLEKEKSSLESELTELRGDNLQSSHTNSVLFIFNLVVGVLLLVALIWMYMRRKSEGQIRPSKPEARPEGDFDHKLDQIQKLGSLRDRGLLTDEEFNFQKKQILGE